MFTWSTSLGQIIDNSIESQSFMYKQLRPLLTNMNASHDPFILKLLPEIASYIFFLSMGKWDTCEIPSEGDCLPMLFLLGAVCSGWRQLARSTPALWTRLAFTLSRASKVMRALPDLVADWLQWSGGLPLTLGVSSCAIYSDPPQDRHILVIDTLNQHSGHWSQVEFKLPPNYVSRLCGSSPPKYLCNLSITTDDEDETNLPLTFKMNTRPNPMKLKIFGFLLEGVDVSWDNHVHLDLSWTTFDGVLQVIRNAPLLEICSLSFILPLIDDFHIPKIIIHHPYLRTLQLLFMEQTDVFHKLINSLELPSLESWSVELVELEESMVLDIMTSFLKHSGCKLKSLKMEQGQVPTVEDFKRFLQAAPCLQCLHVAYPTYVRSLTPVMDNILEWISASPLMQTDHTARFLSDLQSLQLSGCELNTWTCIPLIFQLPHRKLLKVDIDMYSVTISDDVLGELVQLVDQGIELDIYDRSKFSLVI